MTYSDKVLDQVADFFEEDYVDYENRTINFNRDGEIYYQVNKFLGDVSSIWICISDSVDGEYFDEFVSVSVNPNENDIYPTLDYIDTHWSELSNRLFKKYDRHYF